MTWDNDFALEILPDLLGGLWVTVQITLLSMALALVIGLVVAVIRYLEIPVVSPFFTFYVLFVRGTPLLVQAYLVYFVLPEYGVTLSTFLTGVIVLGVTTAPTPLRSTGPVSKAWTRASGRRRLR